MPIDITEWIQDVTGWSFSCSPNNFGPKSVTNGPVYAWLDWWGVEDAEVYIVYGAYSTSSFVSDDNSDYLSIGSVIDSSLTSCIPGGYNSRGYYRWKVAAIENGVEGGMSDYMEFYIASGPTTPPPWPLPPQSPGPHSPSC